jgi:hypothetical protein
MIIANHIQPDTYEVVRSNYLKVIEKDEIRKSRLHCEPQLLRFEKMTAEEQSHYIAVEVMGWTPNTPESAYFVTQENFVRMDSFMPTQDITSAFRVFDYTLIEDKTTLVPCGSGGGRFWAIYYDDIFVGVGKTAEMAICKASIVINDALVMKMNVA